jgi:hypothetical protein
LGTDSKRKSALESSQKGSSLCHILRSITETARTIIAFGNLGAQIRERRNFIEESDIFSTG